MVPKWETLDNVHKAEFARDMEVYAAMLDYMDMSIGRVFDYLKKVGMYNNTMIIFMSDNGANGQMATFYPGNEDGKYLSSFNNKIENRGLQNSYIEMGPGWAQASSSPFRLFKSFTTEGGMRAPLIIKLPGKNKAEGEWNRGFVHVSDLMPTILDLTKSPYPQQRNGHNIHPLIGKSLMPVLNGDSATVHSDDGMGNELFEMKAYTKGKYKILRLPQPFGTGQWQLYDLEKDPAETTDLSEQFPDIKAELLQLWSHYASQNGVFDHKMHYDSIYKQSVIVNSKH
jgi:arylsulfatase